MLLTTLRMKGMANGSTGIVITLDPDIGVQNRNTHLYPVATPPQTPDRRDYTVVTVPGSAGLPTDVNGDGRFENENGNRRRDFADVVLYFNQMSWVVANESVTAYDCKGNGRVDFAVVVWHFNNL